jgi:mRNA interferase HigB
MKWSPFQWCVWRPAPWGTAVNVKGNDYRLIVHIRYSTAMICIEDLLTHAEYDKGTWKE